ncbi:hypothetical protein YYC_02440 [Plasmodium yoelii 17X]|uniref:Uncharacterized protein n=1 Tax=Plasmodium yoelii 17X TaxID=1323249 RepID=V7PKG6_PLAYE|nr:hypothetical protein YYC_02440 [Plasmodium yoelii 17X]
MCICSLIYIYISCYGKLHKHCAFINSSFLNLKCIINKLQAVHIAYWHVCYSCDESSNEDKKCENKEYGIVNNIIYGAGLGVGAIGFSLAVLSSTIIASTLVFSLYFCANTCNISDEELFEECI